MAGMIVLHTRDKVLRIMLLAFILMLAIIYPWAWQWTWNQSIAAENARETTHQSR